MPRRLRIIVAVMAIALSGTLLAQQPRGRGPGGQGRPGGPGPCNPDVIKKALNLTADQSAAFDQITQKEREAAKPLLDQLRELAGDPRRDLEKQIAAIHQDAHAQFVETLTPEQRQKLQDLAPQQPPRGRGDGTPPTNGQRGPRRGGPPPCGGRG